LYPTGVQCGQAVALGLGVGCTGPTEGFKDPNVRCGDTNGSFVVCQAPASLPIIGVALCTAVAAGPRTQECH